MQQLRVSKAIRQFSSYNARFVLPAFRGEPMLDYAPGCPKRAALEAACAKMRNEVVEIPCVVDGKEYFTGNVVEQTMPTDHKHVLARFHQATPELVQKAVEAAQAAKSKWSTMSFNHRAMVFQKAGDLIAGKYRAEFMAATMLGTGKTIWQAEIDAAAEAADFLRLNNKFAEMIYDQQPPLNATVSWNRLEYRELEGFVLAISPFNFTAIGANLCAAPALMGNTVLWKPASTAVLGNYLTYKIFKEAGLPDGVINFLPSAGRVIGEAINHRDFGGLHFTGSTGVFNTLWQQIGANLANYKSYPRIVGETGGKNFHVIHPSADVDHAVNNTIRGAFEYQGQKCSATSRMYVAKSLWPEFKEKMQARLAEVRVSQPDDMKAFMTAVIDKNSFNKQVEYIERAKASPECTIVSGGTYDDSVGWFVQPTVIETTNPRYETMSEELFGPVLTVYVYEDNDWDSMLKLVDTTSPYALTGAVFAQDRLALISAETALKHSSGMLYLNDKSTGAVVGEQPFGGARGSGTNDKAGSHLNLLRWVSCRTTKETTVPLTTWQYPHMQ